MESIIRTGIKITSVQDLITKAIDQTQKAPLRLWRGEAALPPNFKPLIPSAFRNERISTNDEVELAAAYGKSLGIKQHEHNQWDVLARAQHNGIPTRLLDWSANALTALWFSAEKRIAESGQLWLILFPCKLIEERDADIDPMGDTVAFYQPVSRDSRIVAQQGWFSCCPRSLRFPDDIARGINARLKTDIYQFEIPANAKMNIISQLQQLGVSDEILFPDVFGVLNGWKRRNGLLD